MAPCGLGVVSSQPPCLEGLLPGGGRDHRALKNAEPHAQIRAEPSRRGSAGGPEDSKYLPSTWMPALSKPKHLPLVSGQIGRVLNSPGGRWGWRLSFLPPPRTPPRGSGVSPWLCLHGAGRPLCRHGRSASPSVSGTLGCHTDLGLNFRVLGSALCPQVW